MESNLDYWTARALLEWQVELGVSDAIADMPLDRYSLADQVVKPVKSASPQSPKVASKLAIQNDPIDIAKQASMGAKTLDDLKKAITDYDYCALKKGARQTVFSAGSASAKIMIIGEAPGRDEDIQGQPFVGRAGQLLDRMFQAIGLDRNSNDPSSALYITNVVPWRPPQNRDPSAQEIAMMLPFVQRHVELANPEIIVAMGNISCQALLGRRGVTKLRGNWTQCFDRPLLPMFHPAYLLRNPISKREAWADLLALKSRID